MGYAMRLKIKAFSSSLAWVLIGSLDIIGGHTLRGVLLFSFGLLVGFFLVAKVSFSKAELRDDVLFVRNWPNQTFDLELSSLRGVTERSGVNSLRVKISYYKDGSWGKKWLWGADTETRRKLSSLIG